MIDFGPIKVSVMRGDIVECEHILYAVLVAGNLEVVASFGNRHRRIFPRSMIKPVHASSLLLSGASVRFGLTDEEFALGSSSHSGRPFHLEALERWRQKIGINIEDLKCGTHRPFEFDVSVDLIKQDRLPSVLHNNNSGRHLSMLTLCRHFGFDIGQYLSPFHPVQVYLKEISDAIFGRSTSIGPPALEVCGCPAYDFDLVEFALGLAKLLQTKVNDHALNIAFLDILKAMSRHPEMVGDPRWLSTSVTLVTEGRLIVKGGSEGGFVVLSPACGSVVVLKSLDGAYRASNAALLAVLFRFDLLSHSEYDLLSSKFSRRIYGYDGADNGFLAVEIAD